MLAKSYLRSKNKDWVNFGFCFGWARLEFIGIPLSKAFDWQRGIAFLYVLMRRS
jgi:hypothetical protein